MSNTMDVSNAPQIEPKSAKSPNRFRRRLLWVGLTIGILLVIGELIARFALGLGDPPLSIAHPTIEYMFKPSQNCRRFGHSVVYNKYSMRSQEFPKKKANPNEFRVLVLGDSVINGGALTDQSDTVTSQLQRLLERDLNRPVVVGNVSAGSWGPPNLLAYVDVFGWFDADAVVVVLSSHDYQDAPTFTPIVGVDPNFPDHKPYLALQELLTRYAPRLWIKPDPVRAVNPADVVACTTATRRLLQEAHGSGARLVLMAQYPERIELHGPYLEGYAVNHDNAIAEGVPTVELRPGLQEDGSEAQIYLDDIHPSPLARKRIATTLDEAIEKALKGSPTDGQTPATQPR